MLQDPVNAAPGSIDSLFVIISPFNLAVAFNESSCETVILAFIVLKPEAPDLALLSLLPDYAAL